MNCRANQDNYYGYCMYMIMILWCTSSGVRWVVVFLMEHPRTTGTSKTVTTEIILICFIEQGRWISAPSILVHRITPSHSQFSGCLVHCKACPAVRKSSTRRYRTHRFFRLTNNINRNRRVLVGSIHLSLSSFQNSEISVFFA